MKLHYIKILLFVIPLNILLTSYQVNTHKKPHSIPHHTPKYISRVLSECDIQSSNYNNDEDIKSVKESFDDRTSQRFEEYKERMKEKRQKRKEKRDRNVEEIILKDKMDKSLSEKIEKGCLKCGCALGGGVLPVWGLVSGLWYATWSQYVTQTALQAGIEAGISAAIQGVKSTFDLHVIGDVALDKIFTAKTFKDQMFLVGKIVGEYNTMCDNGSLSTNTFFNSIGTNCQNNIPKAIETITARASKVAAEAGQAAKSAETDVAASYTSTTSSLTTSITASVVAIVVIVLIMVIIYLVLRYRRKKKMNKKAQYAKLLNQ
ncbi:rifin PIR protein, putative [Plasmodium reichenowi]|uniref:Rifin PIR protein, putative n=1 Tax=Plasmodium reichenowi TaxID=5854 RepID=A0A2P9DCC2_PLARE|nr:rifin PIR protein, putative [Plasmodium reichenowi]